MALNTPVDLQQATYPAQADRLIWQLLFANTGVVQSGDLLPTQSVTPAMSVLLAAGACVLNVTGSTFVGLGSYLTVNDSSITATIAASNPSLPRIDIVGIVINDGYISGVLNSAVLTVLTGVPNASPVAPSIPTNMVPIASVAVAANATSIVNANITDLRTRSTHT